MISHLEGVKAGQQSKRNRRPEEQELRTALRQIAWQVHTRKTDDFRDFESKEAAHLIAESGRTRFTEKDWHELADTVKVGRFPMLAFIPESGKDLFRFAHLTFQVIDALPVCHFFTADNVLVVPAQEFLAAEHIRGALESFQNTDLAADGELGERVSSIAQFMAGSEPDLKQIFSAGSNKFLPLLTYSY